MNKGTRNHYEGKEIEVLMVDHVGLIGYPLTLTTDNSGPAKQH